MAQPVTASANAAAHWTRQGVMIVALCFLINMVDGMDVNIVTFVRQALQDDWKVPDATMGSVFSAGLLGMGLGALLIAPLADRFGRKRIIMAALALMSAGMIACGYVSSLGALVVSADGCWPWHWHGARRDGRAGFGIGPSARPEYGGRDCAGRFSARRGVHRLCRGCPAESLSLAKPVALGGLADGADAAHCMVCIARAAMPLPQLTKPRVSAWESCSFPDCATGPCGCGRRFSSG